MSFILAGLFVLFSILSFFSIANAYGFDTEITTSSDIDTNDNLNLYSESIQNTSKETNNSESSNAIIDINNSTPTSNSVSDSSSSDGVYPVPDSSSAPNDSLSDMQSSYSDNDKYFNDNYKSNDAYYLIDNEDNLDKISKRSTNLYNIDFNSFYPIQYYNPNFNNYEEYYNDINDYIANHIVLIISNSNSNSILNGNHENFNNLIKEVANLNFNKVDDEDTSSIGNFQSSPKPTLTILLFIKIFMEHHDNGKEHLNSF